MDAAGRAWEAFGLACDISERGSSSSLHRGSRDGVLAARGKPALRAAVPNCHGDIGGNQANSEAVSIDVVGEEGRALEYVIRFLLGGVIVSAFALLGDILRPKSFAGLFGAAPSVALATLGITLLTKGGHYAAVEGRSMIIGSLALAAYSFLVCQLLVRFRVTALVATAPSVIAWLAVALGFRYALLGG